MHVFPNLPAMYWDDGRDFIKPIIQGAMNELVKKGFAESGST